MSPDINIQRTGMSIVPLPVKKNIHFIFISIAYQITQKGQNSSNNRLQEALRLFFHPFHEHKVNTYISYPIFLCADGKCGPLAWF